MIEFEWGNRKDAANRRTHGVAFQQAARTFRNPFAIEWIDDRLDYGEVRMNLLGLCEGTILHITYTERGERIRIISARRATKSEKEYYYRENGF